MEQWLFYGGIAAMAVAAAAGIVAVIALRVGKVRLSRRLEQEYGEKRG